MKLKSVCYSLGILLLISCSKETGVNAPPPSRPAAIRLSEAELERLPLLSDNHRRASDQVLALAEAFMSNQTDTKSEACLRICDSIPLESSLTKGADLNAAPIYVVSRGDGNGFVLVAGDSRVEPVWGVVERGNYVEGENPGFDIVLAQMKDDIAQAIAAKESLRGDSTYIALMDKLALANASASKSDRPQKAPVDPPPVIDYPENYDRVEIVEKNPYYEIEYEYGPLLKTRWGQNWPYNLVLRNTHPDCPVGCVATALAQIMAYHKHPVYMAATGHTYLWDRMLADSKDVWPEDAVASVGYLMVDLGLPQYLDMLYRPGGSKAEGDLGRTWNAFGYAWSPLSDYDGSKVLNEVKQNRPVYVRGDSGSGSNGHAWVADGVLYQHRYVTYWMQFYWFDQLVSEIECGTAKSSSGSYVHHNFGWDGLQDGWYASLEPYNCLHVKPGEMNPSDYRKNMKVITGIKPK